MSDFSGTQAVKEYLITDLHKSTTPKQAARLDNGKPDLHYLHMWYEALCEVAQVCMNGEKKYERGNYLKGQPYSQLLSCAERHIGKFGNTRLPDIDEESGRHHIAHAIWNLLQLLQHEMTDQKQWDNRLREPK